MKKSIQASLLTLLAAALLAPASPAGALFGSGGKKKPAAPAAQPPQADASLPGMEGGSDEDLQPEAQKAQAQPAAQPSGQAPGAGDAAEPKVSESETAVGTNPAQAASGAMPKEVEIKDATGKQKSRKAPLQIQIDPFESIRPSIKPDENLLLAESPLTVVWRLTHPEFLRNARVVQPWRTTFSERPGMIFRPRDMLGDVLGRKLEPKEAKSYRWSLTIADEDGKVFQQFEGSSNPPEEIIWDGQNDQDDWIRAGKAYSPVYMFTDSEGTPYTRAGRPIKQTAFVHQEKTGLHITIDSGSLFATSKDSSRLASGGSAMLRGAADLIKRRYSGVPLRLEAYASSKDLADRQVQTTQDFLIKELMMLPQDVSTDTAQAAFSEQRLEIILLNR
jgi:flagellar motor protein MotB